MKIGGLYPFKNGLEVIQDQYASLWEEVQSVIKNIDSNQCKTKKSKERTKSGRTLYSPPALNKAFKREFSQYHGWDSHKVKCNYPTQYYVNGYEDSKTKGAFRDMDFVKDNLGVEVQLGKYAFMVYNVCAKMTIFHNLGIIQAGIEIVPLKSFVKEMSSGVAYFEQFVWDLEQRGNADIDIPVLIVGITSD